MSSLLLWAVKQGLDKLFPKNVREGMSHFDSAVRPDYTEDPFSCSDSVFFQSPVAFGRVTLVP